MRTTIDAAGRIVVPKSLRDAMALQPGHALDILFTDGRLEIEVAPTPVDVEDVEGIPRAVPRLDLPPLDAQTVRQTLDSTRR